MSGLRHPLTVPRGIALMMNIVIGAGLLALPGLAVRQAGDHAFLGWVLCALASLPLLGAFILLGRRYPNAGGIAHYADVGFGRRGYVAASFLLLGAVLFGLPSIALTGGHYLAALTGLPPYATGLMLLACATLLHLAPSEAVSRVNSVMAVTITLAVVGLAIAGLAFAGAAADGGAQGGVGPLIPEEISLSRAAAPFMMLFFAFTGWEIAANTAEEFRNPRRDFPLAMLASFAVTVALYLAIAYLAQRLDLGGRYETAFATIARASLGAAGETAVALLAGTIILANLAGAIWAVSRLVFSLSREGVLPEVFARTRGGSPWVAVMTTALALAAVIGASGVGLFRLDWMLALSGQNFLILYGVAAMALFRVGRNLLERMLAVGVGLLALALVLAQGLAIAYPLALVALGILVAELRAGRLAPSSAPLP